MTNRSARGLGCALVAAIALAAAPTHAGPLEPTRDQLAAYRATDGTAPVGLVQLLQVRDEDAYQRYLAESRAAVEDSGGTRVYGGSLVRLEDGPPAFRFDALVIDEFPTREVALRALQATKATRRKR